MTPQGIESKDIATMSKTDECGATTMIGASRDEAGFPETLIH